jgi:hypothetical protein
MCYNEFKLNSFRCHNRKDRVIDLDQRFLIFGEYIGFVLDFSKLYSNTRNPHMEERIPNGLQRYDADALTTEEANRIYQRDQFLWIRLGKNDVNKCEEFNLQTIQKQYLADPQFFTKHYSIENACKHDSKQLSALAVFGGGSSTRSSSSNNTFSGPFYASSILQKNEASLSRFFQSVPFAKAPFLKDSYHDDGAWLFFGYNPAQEVNNEGKQEEEDQVKKTGGSKRKNISNKRKALTTTTTTCNQPISGRPEHTDKVQHSGTWHVQLSGTKTWYIRPLKSAKVWNNRPPVLEGKNGSWQGATAGVRLKVCVEFGDLFVINTRVWWHQTKIDPQYPSLLPTSSTTSPTKESRRTKKRKTKNKESIEKNTNAAKTISPGLSISYARDFYLPGNNPASDTTEVDIPTANDYKTNDTTLDPRLIATTMVYSGELAVAEEDLPSDLPRSRDPNCELCVCLVNGEEQMVMLATRDIYIGEPFTIKVEEDENEEDMEEWELNTTTGEMVRIFE